MRERVAVDWPKIVLIAAFILIAAGLIVGLTPWPVPQWMLR